MIKSYIQLTKPGIIVGNIITAIAGFLLSSKGVIDWQLFFATILGLALIIGSACVLNNIYDRSIDIRMERTKNRALVTGVVTKSKALMFGVILGILGVLSLFLFSNLLTLSVAIVGWVVYVFLYTPLKIHTVYATLIGSISGATPPVVGYVAFTNNFDLAVILLFLILVSWQMPHFYAIAIRRLDEYRHASIPVLPIVKGIGITKVHIMVYIIVFILMTSLLTVFGFTGYIYLVVMVLLGLTWLRMSIRGFSPMISNQLWATKMFKFSLIVILAFSIMVSINPV